MSTKQALKALVKWFGHDGFMVRDMSREQVDELARIAEIGTLNRANRRQHIGMWLSQQPSTDTLRVVVVRRIPCPGQPSVYQVRAIGS